MTASNRNPCTGKEGSGTADRTDWKKLARKHIGLSAWEFVEEHMEPAYTRLVHDIRDGDPDIQDATRATEEFWQNYGGDLITVVGADPEAGEAITLAAGLLGSAGHLASDEDRYGTCEAEVARHAAARARRLAKIFDEFAEAADCPDDDSGEVEDDEE